MLRYTLLGAALSAILGGLVLSAPAEASPICISGGFSHPTPSTLQPTCVPGYPLETGCHTLKPNMEPVLEGSVVACLPAPLARP